MFYKLVANGSIMGQDVKNIFWYRTGVGVDVGGLTIGGAAELAQEFYDEVWTPAWKPCVSSYQLQTIEVYPINDDFQLAYSLPFVKSVYEDSGGAGGNIFSPAACVNIKFNLESTPIGQNFFAPKRGYVAIAGVAENDVEANGYLNTSVFNNPATRYGLLAEKLASNIESLLPPVVFFPVRVRLVDNPISNSPLMLGWADIGGAVVDRAISWRKSRRPE